MGVQQSSHTKTRRQESARLAWGAAVPSEVTPTWFLAHPPSLLWTEERCTADWCPSVAPLGQSPGLEGAPQALPFLACH